MIFKKLILFTVLILSIFSFLILSIFSFSACESKGTAEKAGEKIDQAIEKTSNKASETYGAIKEKTEDIVKAVKK
ncbi:hypothetical protein KKI24_30145 [bacterium]|nr:hypothetical protein [bacterium]